MAAVPLLTTLQFLVYPNLWHPQGDRKKVIVDDILPTLETFLGTSAKTSNRWKSADHNIGDIEGFDDPVFDDPLSRGMLVASHPSAAPSLWHRGKISIM